MEFYLGQICLFPYNFVPRGFAACEGQLLSIAQNSALFSLLGTTYGGDGRTTFALPDLRGRAPVSQGQGSGLSRHQLGEMGGAEQVTLSVNQLPAHSHQVNATLKSDSKTPSGQVPGYNGSTSGYGTQDGTTMSANMIANTGGSQSTPTMSPYLTLQWAICLQGPYPSRD